MLAIHHTRDDFGGWPEAATAEKGRRAMEKLVETSLRFVEQVEELGRRG